MKLLKRRARSLGIDEDTIEELDDAADIKSAAIQLIMEATRVEAQRVAQAKAAGALTFIFDHIIISAEIIRISRPDLSL